MILGFTGTQVGMTPPQMASVRQTFDWLPYRFGYGGISEFHHGDCIGADAQAHDMVAMHTQARIVIHPPVDPKKRAWCHSPKIVGQPVSILISVLVPKPYLVRNRDIVDASQVLLATPQGPEELRSGTWSTIRYARKKQKPVLIVWPDGRTEEL